MEDLYVPENYTSLLNDSTEDYNACFQNILQAKEIIPGMSELAESLSHRIPETADILATASKGAEELSMIAMSDSTEFVGFASAFIAQMDEFQNAAEAANVLAHMTSDELKEASKILGRNVTSSEQLTKVEIEKLLSGSSGSVFLKALFKAEGKDVSKKLISEVIGESVDNKAATILSSYGLNGIIEAVDGFKNSAVSLSSDAIETLMTKAINAVKSNSGLTASEVLPASCSKVLNSGLTILVSSAAAIASSAISGDKITMETIGETLTTLAVSQVTTTACEAIFIAAGVGSGLATLGAGVAATAAVVVVEKAIEDAKNISGTSIPRDFEGFKKSDVKEMMEDNELVFKANGLKHYENQTTADAIATMKKDGKTDTIVVFKQVVEGNMDKMNELKDDTGNYSKETMATYSFMNRPEDFININETTGTVTQRLTGDESVDKVVRDLIELKQSGDKDYQEISNQIGNIMISLGA